MHLPLTLIIRITDYWYQLSPGARDNIIGGLIVALVLAILGLLWKFGGRLLTVSKQIDPKPEAVPAPSPQEVKVKVEVVPTTPTPSADPSELARPLTSFVIPRQPAVGFSRDATAKDATSSSDSKKNWLPKRIN